MSPLEKRLTKIGAEWQIVAICLDIFHVCATLRGFCVWIRLKICFAQHRQKSNWNCSESWTSAALRAGIRHGSKEHRDLLEWRFIQARIQMYPTKIWNATSSWPWHAITQGVMESLVDFRHRSSEINERMCYVPSSSELLQIQMH